MKTIETYLPVFSGFYGGYFESQADSLAEMEYEYYNFSNDSINVAIKLKDDNITNIMNYLNENIEEFAEYLKGKYTSCDGFISSYSNDVNDWLNPEALEHSHKLGSILDFILENEGLEEVELFFRVMEVYSPILEIKNDVEQLIKIYE